MNPRSARLVTIAIPTYRRLNYLQEAVASALAQTHPGLEILIGDDGPTAEIETWARQLSATEPRLRYARNARNLGLAGNWNALAAAAKGEFIVLIGDDDRLLPDFLTRLLPLVNSGGVVAFCNQHIIDASGHRLDEESARMTERYHRSELPAGELNTPAITAWKNSIPMSAAIVRTVDVRRLRFKEDLNNPELELFVRLANEGARFLFCPEYLAEYRVHPAAETASGLKSDKLGRYLMDIPVAHEVEPFKRKLLESLLPVAVARCLASGDFTEARRLLKSGYFPPEVRRTPRGFLYALTLALPLPLAKWLFQSCATLRRRWK